jgi:DNA repair protein RadD
MKLIEARDYQAEAAPAVFDYFRRCKGKHPLLAYPTGSGKTIVVVDIVEKILQQWAKTKIVILSHVKEIIEQDKNSLEKYLDTDISVGVNSAGLGRRDYGQLIVAGIQSVFRQGELFSDTNLIIIDEAHLIPDGMKGMYREFFSKMRNVKYLGLTATPFRLGTGYIYGKDDTLFDDLIVDYTCMDKFNLLIKQGHICKLITQATKTELSDEGLNIRGGDFIEKEMSQKFDTESITNAAICEIIKYGANRKKWLIFAIDIAHAEHIAERLLQLGVPTGLIHSKMEMNRDRILSLYRNDKLKCIVNVNVLTTGFDHPSIDLIALLRPTQSPVMHVQTVGRGLRVHPGKDNCLILDFARNTARIGPINDIHIKNRKKSDEPGDPVVKKCPKCETLHHPTVKLCDVCGHEFIFEVKISAVAGNNKIIADSKPDWYSVTDVDYKIHHKHGSPDTLQVTYICGVSKVKQFIGLDHNGYVGHMARHWVSRRTQVNVNTVSELFAIADTLDLPVEIKVDTRNKYPQIIDYKFNNV